MYNSGIGTPYWFEWEIGILECLNMLQDTSIESVILQSTDFQALDDVVVNYSDKSILNIQVKHTDEDANFTYSFLASGKKPLLNALALEWKNNKDNYNFKGIQIVTNKKWGPQEIDGKCSMDDFISKVFPCLQDNYNYTSAKPNEQKAIEWYNEFCIREQITDIQLLELEQETAFQDYLKQKVEKEQRRKRLKSIVETARKVIFIETDETRWDATIWYLERFRIAKERINQSDSIEKISFQEVLQPKNRLLLQEYMKYEIGIGELALSTVYERFRTIRNFLQEISELEVTKCDASLIDVYLKNLQNGAMGAKTFNTNVSGIQFFMKFLEVKGYIKKIPFYASYYLEKQIPVHHDRSVEEDVYMEIIQNLSQFPEHLRMMFLHLWCVGLRISEVCTLKGDAYYIQNGDCWMKVYQVKMKNYKRVPIPVTLYRLMQVYLKKHPTEKEAYIFRNRKGGAFSKSTFMGQMKKYCSQIGIQNGEYIFKSHDYRHTVATNFYEHGVSIQSIRDYLGHTFEEMTMQYIDYMPRKIAKENDAYFEEEENSLLACMQKGEKHG